ncbi:uncharacterized [Tachysurus ichikawai]
MQVQSQNLHSCVRHLGDGGDATPANATLQITLGIMGNPCSATHRTDICFHIIRDAETFVSVTDDTRALEGKSRVAQRKEALCGLRVVEVPL